MQNLTQEEINFIKDMYTKHLERQRLTSFDAEIESAWQKIAQKYKPLLEKAAESGDFELRKRLIEEQTLEAKAKEIEIRSSQ